MIHEGTAGQRYYKNGCYIDVAQYATLMEDCSLEGKCEIDRDNV